MSDEPTHEDLVEQAESVLSATKASMYHPVAHGEAEVLQNMIDRKLDAGSETGDGNE